VSFRFASKPQYFEENITQWYANSGIPICHLLRIGNLLLNILFLTGNKHNVVSLQFSIFKSYENNGKPL